MGNLVFGTETCHLLAGEVHPIVKDDGMRELDDLLSRDVSGTAFTYLVSWLLEGI